MNLYEILGILLAHYVFDFIFQHEDWAIGKSKSIVALLKHTVTYSAMWFLLWAIVCRITYNDVYGHYSHEECMKLIFVFPVITFVIHTITDYFTSKVTSRLYTKGKFGGPIPNLGFFSMIGFDQWLHYIQLFVTYWLIVL